MIDNTLSNNNKEMIISDEFITPSKSYIGEIVTLSLKVSNKETNEPISNIFVEFYRSDNRKLLTYGYTNLDGILTIKDSTNDIFLGSYDIISKIENNEFVIGSIVVMNNDLYNDLYNEKNVDNIDNNNVKTMQLLESDTSKYLFLGGLSAAVIYLLTRK